MSINPIAIPGNKSPKTMSSLEIAELTGKNHADVLRDIKKVLAEAEIDASKFAGIYLDAYNREKPCFNLPRRECDLVIAGYSVKYRLAIIDRWQELEAQLVQPTIPTIDPLKALSDPATMRQLLLGYTEKVIEQEETIAALTPKAEALERLENSEDGSLNITEAAKVSKVKRDYLFDYLWKAKWIYRRVGGKNWVGYADKEQQGLIKNDTQIIIKPDGTEKVTVQVRITPKGLAKLSMLLNGNGGDK